MTTSQLQTSVAKLQRTVEADVSFSKPAADEIRQQVRELATLLDEMTANTDGPLNDQLTRIAAEFEADYPQTSRVLERMADTLSKLGI